MRPLPEAARSRHRSIAVISGDIEGAGVKTICEITPKSDLLVDTYYGGKRPMCIRGYFVYGLMSGDRIIYVGKTADLSHRICCHSCPSSKFDAAFWIELDSGASAAWWESVVIDMLRPEWNRHWGGVMIERHIVEQAMELLMNHIEDDRAQSAIRRALDYQAGTTALR